MKKILISVLSIIIIISLSSCTEMYNKLNEYNSSSSNQETSQFSEIKSVNLSSVSDISFHFIDYGIDNAGDTTYIKAGDTDILIDAGPRNSSAEVIENYVDNFCTDGKLEYVISTHAHQDHIAGFVGTSTIKGIFDYYKIDNLIGFSQHNTNSNVYNDYKDGLSKLLLNGTNVYDGLDFYGDTKTTSPKIEISDGITMTILDNYFYRHKSSDENNYSVCTLFTSGNLNALFTGDLEKEGEEKLVELNNLPEVDLFKAGHHGSYTANNDVLLDVIKPKNVVFTCVAGTSEYTKIDKNQFPSQSALDRLSTWTDKMYCLREVDPFDDDLSVSMNGDIVFGFNSGSEISLTCSNNTTLLKDSEWFKNNRTLIK